MEVSVGILNTLSREKKYLLAISGGMDSMVLLHLFSHSQFNFSVVHCNFQLRGEESDLDEQLVINYCNHHDIEVFTKKIDTLNLKKNRESLEMIARTLRYEYFNELLQQHSFSYLVTAHHLNDNVETFFINLLRGSGLKGLAGMKLVNHQISRPLLPFTQKEILNFAIKNTLVWREDQTNKTLDYLRNKIRHKVIPVLEEIAPVFLYQAEKSMEIIHSSQLFIEKKTEEMKSEALIYTRENSCIFSYDKLKNTDFILVYYLLSQYGFTNKKEIQNIIKAKTGNIFQSPTHKIWIDRDQLIIETTDKNSENSGISILIEKLPTIITNPIKLKISFSKETVDKKYSEILDFGTISLPLTLRTWKEGDYFYPINGNGKKKVSKYLKDEKISNFEKNKILVLCDASGAVIWLVGFRLDDRFKITDKSNKFAYLYLI